MTDRHRANDRRTPHPSPLPAEPRRGDKAENTTVISASVLTVGTSPRFELDANQPRPVAPANSSGVAHGGQAGSSAQLSPFSGLLAYRDSPRDARGADSLSTADPRETERVHCATAGFDGLHRQVRPISWLATHWYRVVALSQLQNHLAVWRAGSRCHPVLAGRSL